MSKHNLLDYEFRTPIVTFSIPFPAAATNSNGNTHADTGNNLRLSLVLPSIQFWTQITQVIIIQALVGCLMAAIVHKFIIKKRRQVWGSTSVVASTPTSAVLIGWVWTSWKKYVWKKWMNLSLEREHFYYKFTILIQKKGENLNNKKSIFDKKIFMNTITGMVWSFHLPYVYHTISSGG